MEQSLRMAKLEAKRAARDLLYYLFKPDVYDKIQKARNITEIGNIMVDCRHTAEETIWR